MDNAFKYAGERKSHQSLHEIYFWNSVIKDWKHLLKADEMKMIIIGSFQWLIQYKLVNIYGYVIMDNHMRTPARANGIFLMVTCYCRWFHLKKN